jgi:hypothetical protein
MSEDQYRVILKGYSPGKGEYFIELEFAKLFKITPEKAKELFKSSPKTIKENLPREQAEKYKKAIEQIGALCELENMKFDTSGLSLE